MTSPPRRALLLGLAAVLIARSALAAEGKGERVVKADAVTQRRLGVVVSPLAAARRGAGVAGIARVLDPGPLAALESDIDTAAAAARASQAEAARSKALNAQDQAISAKALEAAQAQARADGARVTLLLRRLGLEWGPALVRMSDGQRANLINALAAGRAALLRIDTASGEGQAGLRSAEVDLGPAGKVQARILGSARTADLRLLSPGLIAVVSGASAGALSSGLTAPCRLETSGPVAGVLLPRAALVRTAGQTWVYVKRDAETFQRRPVVGGQVDPGGLFAASGFRPGELVATSGAGALFAAETGGGEAE